MIIIFIKNLLFLLSFHAVAQSAQNYEKIIELDTDSKKIAQELALNEISRDLIIAILGKKEYQKQRAQIEKQIIKNKNRYVLSISSSSGKMEDTGKFSFVVNIKISKDNLSSLLKQYSFLKGSSSSYCILPLISFSSQFGKERQTWSWWSPEEPFSYPKQIARSFFDSLGKEFTKVGFYFIDPVFQKTAQAVPASLFPKRSKKMKYFKPVIDFYSCDIILSGFAHIGKSGEGELYLGNTLDAAYSLQFVIKGFNRQTKESLFELSRNFPLKKESPAALQKTARLKSQEVIESLIYQFSFYKERGSLDLDRLMIALQGNLSYPEKERLINEIAAKAEGLKNIQIVYLSSQRAVYRAEVSEPLNEIVEKLKALKFRAFAIQVRKSSSSKLEIYAKRKK